MPEKATRRKAPPKKPAKDRTAALHTSKQSGVTPAKDGGKTPKAAAESTQGKSGKKPASAEGKARANGAAKKPVSAEGKARANGTAKKPASAEGKARGEEARLR